MRQGRRSNYTGNGFSPLKEAEGALARGQACVDPEQAVIEYTHAINAINYLASSTGGSRFVLRAVDILLIAHGKRAELEDNLALFDSIVEAHPKASVKSARNHDQVWYLSSSAYEALFYPLQSHGRIPASGRFRCHRPEEPKERSCVQLPRTSKADFFGRV